MIILQVYHGNTVSKKIHSVMKFLFFNFNFLKKKITLKMILPHIRLAPLKNTKLLLHPPACLPPPSTTAGII